MTIRKCTCGHPIEHHFKPPSEGISPCSKCACQTYVFDYTKLPRPYKAGVQLAKALGETANILYLLDNREQYL